jgi:hypothetical protein
MTGDDFDTIAVRVGTSYRNFLASSTLNDGAGGRLTGRHARRLSHGCRLRQREAWRSPCRTAPTYIFWRWGLDFYADARFRRIVYAYMLGA